MDKKQLAFWWSMASVFGISAYVIAGKLAFNSGIGDAVNFSCQVAFAASVFLFLAAMFGEGKKSLRVSGKSIKYILMAGLFGGALNYGFSFFGLQHTTAINSSFVTEASVFFTVILAFIFLGERLNLSKALLVIFLLFGVYLVSTGGNSVAINNGDIFILIASFFVSVGYIFAKRGLCMTPAIIFSAYRTIFASVVLFGYLLVSGALVFPIYYFWALVNGAAQAAGIFATYKALEYATASYASLMMVVTTVVTAICAWIFLGESMNVAQMTGGAIILISVYFVEKANV